MKSKFIVIFYFKIILKKNKIKIILIIDNLLIQKNIKIKYYSDYLILNFNNFHKWNNVK